MGLARLILVTLVAAGPFAVTPAADMFRGVAAFEQGDFREALRELEPLARGGNVDAQYYVARMYHQGHVDPDPAVAATWYRRAAEQGHARAQNNLGVLYEKGDGVGQDLEEAAGWYRRAAEQGVMVAQTNLAVLLDDGKVGAPDPEEAVRWLTRAADAGHDTAQYRLGVLFDAGRGVAANPTRAAHWFQKAARQGHGEAAAALANLYQAGRGVRANARKASKWRRIAEAEGIAVSQVLPPAPEPLPEPEPVSAPAPAPVPEPEPEPVRGSPAPAPVPVPATPPEPAPPAPAVADAALDADAAYARARRFATGDGVPASSLEAGRLYLRAARAGHPLAAYHLALQYWNAQGVAEGRELDEAHFWFRVAEAAGVGDSARWRERVEKKLSRREREESERRYREWSGAD